jgi:hypothetical protein
MNANSAGKGIENARDCRRFRERLCAQPAAAPAAPEDSGAGPLAAHLASCLDCAAFALRLELAHQELGRPLSAMEPDPAFPARVLARIAQPAELMGWAAFRALPAALGLALALACLGVWLPAVAPSPAASPLLDEPPSSDQLLAWSSLSPEVWP